MKKNFAAMAEVGMRGRPAGPGRDEFSSSHFQIGSPGPVRSDFSKDFAIRPNRSLSRHVSGAACCSFFPKADKLG